MRINEDLIEKSDIIKAIIDRIETIYPSEISLLVCYGSYISGNHNEISDIDFFFVPKTNKGYELEYQFIIDGIGYDLWAVSWERLNRISNLDDIFASILMDGKILYASSEKDVKEINNLKENLKTNLKNESHAKRQAMNHILNSKGILFDLQNQEKESIDAGAVSIMENLMFSLALMNGTYTQQGVKSITSETREFSLMPPGFLDRYCRITRENGQKEILQILKEQIIAVETTWRGKYESGESKPEITDLIGFYEEFKSTYNKLHRACREHDYPSAYYAAHMIDRETRALLVKFVEPGTFPKMTVCIKSNDFDTISKVCDEHEKQLKNLLNKNSIKINEYKFINEFVQAFSSRAS